MRSGWKKAALAGSVIAVSLTIIPIASAHNPVVHATLDCNGTVSYSVGADEQNSTRNNNDVELFDTSGIGQPVATGVFNSGNSWFFSGSYTIPTGVTSDTLTPRAIGVWGDGANPSSGPSVTLHRPDDCVSATSVTTHLSATTIAAGGSAHDSASLTGATSTAGGTVHYVVYPSLAACHAGTGGIDAGTAPVTNGVPGDSNVVTFPNAGTYYWQAVYSGDSHNGGSSSPCTSELLTVNPATPSISTVLSATTIAVGGTAHDTATLTGATSNAGGTVTYSLSTDNSCSTLSTTPALNQQVTVTNGVVPSSQDVTFPNAGTYYWQARYSGDGNNASALSPCTSEILTVSKATPTIATTLSATSITAGGTAHDSSTLTGATSSAGGTVTYSVYPTLADCNAGTGKTDAGTKAVTAHIPGDSNTLTFANAGTYAWQVVYSGDGNNAGAASTCTSELMAVTTPPTPPTPPSTPTTPPPTPTTTPPTTPPVTPTATPPVTPFTPPITPAVTHPKISIVKDPRSQSLATGGTATFKITVTNTGDVALASVTIKDPRSADCDRSFGSLAAGASRSYSCTRLDVKLSFMNTATATGKPPTGPNVTDSDTATVKVAPFTPPPVAAKKVVKHKAAKQAVKHKAAKKIVQHRSSTKKVVTHKVKPVAKPKLISHVAPKTTG